jgi:hypothetical protein
MTSTGLEPRTRLHAGVNAVLLQVLSAVDGFEVELLSLWQVSVADVHRHTQHLTCSAWQSCKQLNTLQHPKQLHHRLAALGAHLSRVASSWWQQLVHCRQRHDQSSSTGNGRVGIPAIDATSAFLCCCCCCCCSLAPILAQSSHFLRTLLT